MSIKGTCQRLDKEILCKPAEHKCSGPCKGGLPFELPSLPLGLLQPMHHQAQKLGPGAKCNPSQSWQPKMLRKALVQRPERQEAKPVYPIPWRSQDKDQGAEITELEEGWGTRLSSKRGTWLLPRDSASRWGQLRLLNPLLNEQGTHLVVGFSRSFQWKSWAVELWAWAEPVIWARAHAAVAKKIT